MAELLNHCEGRKLGLYDKALCYFIMTEADDVQSCTKYLVHPALNMLNFIHFCASAGRLLQTPAADPTDWTLSERRI